MLRLGDVNNGWFTSNTNSAVGKIYSAKVTINGELVRDFLPALDTSNVPCLYDKISKKYFYNSGTGNFNYQ